MRNIIRAGRVKRAAVQEGRECILNVAGMKKGWNWPGLARPRFTRKVSLS